MMSVRIIATTAIPEDRRVVGCKRAPTDAKRTDTEPITADALGMPLATGAAIPGFCVPRARDRT